MPCAAGPIRAQERGMQDRGFTLIEVLVAVAILSMAALGGLQLVSMATGMMADARRQSLAANLASARLEQLRSLRLAFDPAGLPITDTSTDLSVEPPAAGGAGLAPSGPAALDGDVPGYVDYLDGRGRWLGNGPGAPRGAALVRRWSIEPMDASGDLLAVQVLVRSLAGGPVAAGARAAGDVRFVTLLVRVAR
jgi:prepilin-type N-terminal cleavage/methylation domain-containing protein